MRSQTRSRRAPIGKKAKNETQLVYVGPILQKTRWFKQEFEIILGPVFQLY